MGPIINFLVSTVSGLFAVLFGFLVGLFTDTMGLKGDETLNLFYSTFPGAEKMWQWSQWCALFIIILIFFFQLAKTLAGPITRAEHPVALLVKTLFFAALAASAKPLCMAIFSIATLPYTWMSTLTKVPAINAFVDGVTAIGNDVGATIDTNRGGALVGEIICPLFSIICIFAIGFAFIRLLMEVAERYILLGIFSIFSPLCIATGVSENTNKIFKSWVQVMISQCLLICMNVFFLNIFISGLGSLAVEGTVGATSDVLSAGINPLGSMVTGGITTSEIVCVKLVLLLGWCRTGCSIDKHLQTLGLSTAQAGQGIVSEMFAASAKMKSTGQTAGNAAKAAKQHVNAFKTPNKGSSESTSKTAASSAGGSTKSASGNKPISNSNSVGGASKLGANLDLGTRNPGLANSLNNAGMQAGNVQTDEDGNSFFNVSDNDGKDLGPVNISKDVPDNDVPYAQFGDDYVTSDNPEVCDTLGISDDMGNDPLGDAQTYDNVAIDNDGNAIPISQLEDNDGNISAYTDDDGNIYCVDEDGNATTVPAVQNEDGSYSIDPDAEAFEPSENNDGSFVQDTDGTYIPVDDAIEDINDGNLDTNSLIQSTDSDDLQSGSYIEGEIAGNDIDSGEQAVCQLDNQSFDYQPDDTGSLAMGEDGNYHDVSNAINGNGDSGINPDTSIYGNGIKGGMISMSDDGSATVSMANGDHFALSPEQVTQAEGGVLVNSNGASTISAQAADGSTVKLPVNGSAIIANDGAVCPINNATGSAANVDTYSGQLQRFDVNKDGTGSHVMSDNGSMCKVERDSSGHICVSQGNDGNYYANDTDGNKVPVNNSVIANNPISHIDNNSVSQGNDGNYYANGTDGNKVPVNNSVMANNPISHIDNNSASTGSSEGSGVTVQSYTPSANGSYTTAQKVSNFEPSNINNATHVMDTSGQMQRLSSDRTVYQENGSNYMKGYSGQKVQVEVTNTSSEKTNRVKIPTYTKVSQPGNTVNSISVNERAAVNIDKNSKISKGNGKKNKQQ